MIGDVTYSSASTPVVEGDSVGLGLSTDSSSDNDSHSGKDGLGEEHIE